MRGVAQSGSASRHEVGRVPETNQEVDLQLNKKIRNIRGVAQSGSAPGLGPGGPRFESWCPDTRSCLLTTPFLLMNK